MGVVFVHFTDEKTEPREGGGEIVPDHTSRIAEWESEPAMICRNLRPL